MIRILFVLIIFTCISCNNKDLKYYDLPNDILINNVIKRIIEIDSIKTEKGFFISKRLCPYSLDYSLDIKSDSLKIPKSPNFLSVNPITPKIIVDFFNTKIDTSISISDSVFYYAQIEFSKNRFIDTTLYKDFKFINIDFLEHGDCYRLDSNILFYVPIFTKDNEYVYINYHYHGHGKGTILKKNHDNWILYKEFDTRNRY